MKTHSEIKSYNLSLEAIDALEELTERLNNETRLKFSMSKALEIAIFFAESKTTEEIINTKRNLWFFMFFCEYYQNNRKLS